MKKYGSQYTAKGNIMDKWLLIVSVITVTVVIIMVFIGQVRESAKANKLLETLIRSASQPATNIVDFNSFSELPSPVEQYLRYALTDGQMIVKTVKMQQSGILRSSINNEKWYKFKSSQVISPSTIGFVWNAQVEMPLSTHIRVHDSYCSGIGSGRVAFLSAFTVASDTNIPELNSGALHRYLAEAVWYPTALLPMSGVIWTAIDDNSALATLTDNNITVSLEFRFNNTGEVTSIFTPERFYRNSNGTYQAIPWEIHIGNYKVRDGMRVPFHAEVGWHIDGVLELVWSGDVINASYEFSK